MVMRRTNLSELVELKLGEPLREYVVARRTVSSPLDRQAGWREIAKDLSTKTGVSVSWESLRSWFDDERESVPA